MSKSTICLSSTHLAQSINIPVSLHSDGAINVNFPLDLETVPRGNIASFFLEANIKDSDGLLALSAICQRLHNIYMGSNPVQIVLNMPYLPYARQDRYTGNNCFTFLHSVVPLLRECSLHALVIVDPHSQATVDLLHRHLPDTIINVIEQRSVLDYDILTKRDTVSYDSIVAPDRGALQRALTIAQELGQEGQDIVYCLDKTRDPDTGRLSFEDFKLEEGDAPLGRVLMVDDIGDGCMTHILAAQKLKEAGATHVTLALTHGILSKGIQHLSPMIDRLIIGYDWRDSSKTLEIHSLHEY